MVKSYHSNVVYLLTYVVNPGDFMTEVGEIKTETIGKRFKSTSLVHCIQVDNKIWGHSLPPEVENMFDNSWGPFYFSMREIEMELVDLNKWYPKATFKVVSVRIRDIDYKICKQPKEWINALLSLHSAIK